MSQEPTDGGNFEFKSVHNRLVFRRDKGRIGLSALLMLVGNMAGDPCLRGGNSFDLDVDLPLLALGRVLGTDLASFPHN